MYLYYLCFTVKIEFAYFKFFDNGRVAVRWESRWSFLWTTDVLNKKLCKHKENGRKKSVFTHRHGVWRCTVTQDFSVLKEFKVLNYSDLFFPSAACEFSFLWAVDLYVNRWLGLCPTIGDFPQHCCVPQAVMWMAWKDLTEERSLHSSFSQDFTLPTVLTA